MVVPLQGTGSVLDRKPRASLRFALGYILAALQAAHFEAANYLSTLFSFFSKGALDDFGLLLFMPLRGAARGSC